MATCMGYVFRQKKTPEVTVTTLILFIQVDVMLGKEIPELMKLIQKEEAEAVAKQKTEAPIKGV